MRRFSSWRFTVSVSLLRTTILLSLGVILLSWPAGGSEVSAALTVADAPFAEQAANGDGFPIDDYYLAMFAAEGEAGEKLPINAVLFRTLISMFSFGTALGWLLAASCWMRCRPEVCLPITCGFHSMVQIHQRRGVATLFGVFRL